MAERSTCREIVATYAGSGVFGGAIGGFVLNEGLHQERPALLAIGAVTTLATAAMAGVGIIRRPTAGEQQAPVFSPEA